MTCLGRYPDRRRAERARAQLSSNVPREDTAEWWGQPDYIVRVAKDDEGYWIVERIDRDVLIGEANAS
jgi:hypothetical protein